MKVHRLHALVDAALRIRRRHLTIQVETVRVVCLALRGLVKQLPRAGRVASVGDAGMRFRHDRTVDHPAFRVIEKDRLSHRRDIEIELEPFLFLCNIAFGLSFAGKAAVQL